jgi:hypothetical protein
MAFPLVPFLAVLPELIKQIKTRPKSWAKEGAYAGIGTAIYWFVQDVGNCAADGFSSLTCVTPDHWSLLAMGVLALVVRLNHKADSKRGEA